MKKTIDGIYHNPYGANTIYQEEEFNNERLSDRYPRDPQQGEDVYIKCTTWPIGPNQQVNLIWEKNGIKQQVISAQWKENIDNNSYWEAKIDNKLIKSGDIISYYMEANDLNKLVNSEKYEFNVVSELRIINYNRVLSFENNRVIIEGVANNGEIFQKIYCSVAFLSEESAFLQWNLDNEFSELEFTPIDIIVDTNFEEIEIKTNMVNYIFEMVTGRILKYEKIDLSTIIDSISIFGNNTGYVNEATITQKHFFTTNQVMGFGENYQEIEFEQGEKDIYVYNQYTNQGIKNRSYMPIPFYKVVNEEGTDYNSAFLLNNSFYSKFSVDKGKITIMSKLGGNSNNELSFYQFGNNNSIIMKDLQKITPINQKLARSDFGLWMSANEWKSQNDIEKVIINAQENNIIGTNIVIEQWSDEQTFYIFNGAKYETKIGGKFKLEEFDFSESLWPNPKFMIETLHQKGMKIYLWQVPVLKPEDGSHFDTGQRKLDEKYIEENNFDIKNHDGTSYKLPPGWFAGGTLLDFTNNDAKDWWLSQRDYLINDLNIDGFKTDGGEMVIGHDLILANGKKGSEMRNQYPLEYVKSYNNYVKSSNKIKNTFSRSGTTNSGKYGIYWTGDQYSNWQSFSDALNAGINASESGIPYWTWDLAGFTSDINNCDYPNSELYKRSFQVSAFLPIMQFHSEKSSSSDCGSEERSPWNASLRNQDPSILINAQHYLNTRLNLIPYLSHLNYENIQTNKGIVHNVIGKLNPLDFKLGSSLYVVPQTHQMNVTTFPVSNTTEEWYDLWTNERYLSEVGYQFSIDKTPVVVEPGSILPLDLSKELKIGKMDKIEWNSFQNQCYKIYPSAKGAELSYYDEIENLQKIINYNVISNNLSEIIQPKTNLIVYYKLVIDNKQFNIQVGTDEIKEVISINELIEVENGYYYDENLRELNIKVSNLKNSEIIKINY